MCNDSGIQFGTINLTSAEIQEKRVLEIGAMDVNGSLRKTIELFCPNEYIGVDIERGSGVDVVCGAEEILEKFGAESFDAVISTEMLEHVQDWKTVVSNIKNVCRPGGIILLTTRSYGFKYHGYPHDFWRYELEDMQNIFSDFEIQALQSDPEAPGVFLKAKRPERFKENDLSDYKLYSIVTNKKMVWLRREDFNNPYFMRLRLKMKLKKVKKHLKKTFRRYRRYGQM